MDRTSPPFAAKASDSFPLTASPCECRAVAQRHESPKALGHCNRPRQAHQESCRVMTGQQEDLIPGNPADGFGMPATQACATQVPSDGFGNVDTGNSGTPAAEPEI